MAISHAIASGMGGMRAAGDLVARMQMTRGMKIDEAKAYVADKLSISVSDLTDPVIMTDIRQDLEIGSINPLMIGCSCPSDVRTNIERRSFNPMYCVSISEVSVSMRATMTVMLSCPPASLDMSTNRFAASRGVAPARV